MLLVVMLLCGSLRSAAQITLYEATDVTQTKATLSADFPDLNAEHGFQYKYGILPEIDDFSRTALHPLSDPVQLKTSGAYAWTARSVKGWVESNKSVPVGQSSGMYMDINLTSDTQVSFEWSVDSQENMGILSFSVDDTAISSISGLQDFQIYKYNLPAGQHRLAWTYSKSSSTSIGLDIGMVRNINIQNSTSGSWVSVTTNSNNVLLENIYPQKSHLFRAFAKAPGTNNYEFSSIGSFVTNSIGAGQTTLTHITQTTADISLIPQPGDAEVKIRYDLFDNEAYENAPFFQYLLDEDTFGGKISTTSDLTQWSVHTDEEWNCVSASAWLELTFTLDAPATISFEWANRSSNGKCNPSLTIDGVEKYYYISVSTVKPSDFRKYEIDLSAGEHTLKWYHGYYRVSLNTGYSGTNYLRNLSIPGLAKSLIHEKEVICNGNQPIQFSEKGLKPNKKYYVQSYLLPDFTSELPYDWDIQKSELFSFVTLPVYAKSCIVSEVMQSSAVIKGEMDGGDAPIEAIGIQFKEESGSDWIDNPLAPDQFSFTHKISRLRPNTRYICRSYIKPVDADIVFSTESSFMTNVVEACRPEILSLSQHEVTLQGKVIYGDANIYQRGMQFREKGALQWEEVEDGGTADTYTLIRKNLQMGTDYEARTYVQPAGCEVIYSDILQFTTLDNYFVKGWEQTTQTTVTLTASLADVDEETTVDEYGFEYFIDADGFFEHADSYVKSDVVTIPAVPSDGKIQTVITGLTPYLTLRWRTYAKVNGQTVYFSPSPGADWRPASTQRATLKPSVKGITTTSISIELDATQDGDAEVSDIEYAFANSVQDTQPYIPCGNALILENLTPATKYNIRFRGMVNGRLCPLSKSASDDYSWFEYTTRPVYANVAFSDITQTKARMEIGLDAGSAEVTDLRCRLNNGAYHDCSYSQVLEHLTPDTEYTVVIYAKINGKEFSWSTRASDQTPFKFTTRPVTASLMAFDITQTAVRLRWNSSFGDATFISSGVELNSSVIALGEMSGEKILTELAPNTSYTCRSFIETAESGKIYSASRSFRTKSIICENLPVSSISNRSATMNGTIDCDAYSSAEFGFQWKQMQGWSSDPAFTKGVKLDDGSISVALVNGMLEPNTDYQYRAAVRYRGTVYYASGWETFRTESEFIYYPASVYTVFRTDRENNSLILCGYYVAGSESVVSQGYEYWGVSPAGSRMRVSQNPVVITTDESMQHIFTPGELPDGNYNVRAFVRTESGSTIYGATLCFTSSPGGYSAIETVTSTDEPAIKAENGVVRIYNAAGFDCYIYHLNGMLLYHDIISGDYEEIPLTADTYCIVRLSNGLVRKIRL